MTPRRLQRLHAELKDDLDRFNSLLDDIVDAQNRITGRDPDSYDLRAIATIIHDVYRGAEAMMTRVAKVVDNSVPTGEIWHRQLLDQLAQPVPTLRPAVLTAVTANELDRFRAFRHVQRNIYGFELLWPQMLPLFDTAPEAIAAVEQDFRTFLAFLETQMGEEADAP